jgi:DNA-binding MarR family transcriptional regulator
MDDVNTSELGFLIHDVARLMRRRFEQHARNCGLTRSQWQVLAALYRNEGIHQSGLAELLELEPITLGRIVDKLQEAGFVERRPHPTDRRVWLLALTAEARPKLEELRAIGLKTRSEAFEGVPAADVRKLAETLQVLRANLSNVSAIPGQTKRVNYG